MYNFSIQVCDWRLSILNVNARYPGSTHDSYIWNNSNLKIGMETIHRVWPDKTFLHYTPQIACKIINACVVLHNICIKNNIPFPQYDDKMQDDMFNQQNGDNGEEIANRVNPELAAGKQLRRRLIRNYFG